MDWYIKDIVVYGKDGTTRAVSLQPGINIVTGDSKTGKSALIPIVDYCLGSTEYDVPVGIIREYADWYSIRIQTSDCQIFLARKEPGGRSISNDMHISIGREVLIPPAIDITGKTHRDAVVEELTRRLGMMEEGFAESLFDTAYSDPPTARMVAPFLFQPQNIVANKDILFYKTDRDGRHQAHRQRLLRVFPFVLGAVGAQYFRLKGELDAAKSELRRSEQFLNRQLSLAEEGTSVARSLWEKAVTLGLVAPGDGTLSQGDAETRHDVRALLDLRKRLANVQVMETLEDLFHPANPSEPERVIALEAESRRLRGEIAMLRQRLKAARELDQEATQFAGAMHLQMGRLRAVDLFQDENEGNSPICPLCKREVNDILPDIHTLRAFSREVQSQLESVTSAKPALKTHIDTIQKEADALRVQLSAVESVLADIYRTQNEIVSASMSWAERQRLIGEIKFYLEHVPTVSEDVAELQRRVDQTRRRVERLETDLSEFEPEERIQSALSVVAQTMFHLGQDLDLERPDAALRLDIKRLTVVRDSPTGKPERLYEIGSGENWVGYHLCALFALHSFFITAGSPVPSFLFIDQPSQIYFPEEGKPSSGGNDERERRRQTDWEAVSRVYRMIFNTVRSLDNRLQVVVLDHADLKDPAEFQQYVRVRWRDGEKFI